MRFLIKRHALAPIAIRHFCRVKYRYVINVQLHYFCYKLISIQYRFVLKVPTETEIPEHLEKREM